MLFISNYVLGLIVSVAKSRGHTHTCVSGDEVEGRGSDSDLVGVSSESSEEPDEVGIIS